MKPETPGLTLKCTALKRGKERPNSSVSWAGISGWAGRPSVPRGPPMQCPGPRLPGGMSRGGASGPAGLRLRFRPCPLTLHVPVLLCLKQESRRKLRPPKPGAGSKEMAPGAGSAQPWHLSWRFPPAGCRAQTSGRSWALLGARGLQGPRVAFTAGAARARPPRGPRGRDPCLCAPRTQQRSPFWFVLSLSGPATTLTAKAQGEVSSFSFAHEKENPHTI